MPVTVTFNFIGKTDKEVMNKVLYKYNKHSSICHRRMTEKKRQKFMKAVMDAMCWKDSITYSFPSW